MALVLVLTMLAVMIILCTFALSTSTLEIKISGNFRATQEALNAGERGLHYALRNLKSGLDLNTEPSPNGGGKTLADDIALAKSGLDTTAINSANVLYTGPPPHGWGMEANVQSGIQAQYYVINVHGEFPQGAPNPSRSDLEMQAATIVAR